MATNPGSYVEIEFTSDDHRFRRFFVCFGASLIGFETGCRPLLFLDGTFLESKYQGILLSIIAKNGDEGFFPLAFSVVDQETKDNWTWTLTCLKKIISADRTITFISDRGKGLMLAIPGVFPTSHHSYCLRHLKMNFREAIAGKFSITIRKKLLQLLDAAAYGLRIEDYTRALAHMHGYSEQAAKWVEDSDPNHWANALFSGERYGEMYSNCAESFNSWILEARNLPIVQMVDHIRVQMMEMMYRRHNESSNWETFLCPSIMEKLQKIQADSRGLQVRCSFEVRGRRNEAVNLIERTCTCRRWQVYGLPCVHACAAVWKINGSIHEYCSHYF
ncbi:hypothetical protein QJS04_geneDACA012721 [Acorus gramineus]|uniref:SWIM-type domain-containing protein n=1 Tax=Acorus gramineus TaxID=55184 RepID=A0AAV9A1S8_ACOGR|nr:hypothetical protein QJS04_geneDACA012721 [Acorus gramineus]